MMSRDVIGGIVLKNNQSAEINTSQLRDDAGPSGHDGRQGIGVAERERAEEFDDLEAAEGTQALADVVVELAVGVDGILLVQPIVGEGEGEGLQLAAIRLQGGDKVPIERYQPVPRVHGDFDGLDGLECVAADESAQFRHVGGLDDVVAGWKDESQQLLALVEDLECFGGVLFVQQQHGGRSQVRVRESLLLASLRPTFNSPEDGMGDVLEAQSLGEDDPADVFWQVRELNGLALHTLLQLGSMNRVETSQRDASNSPDAIKGIQCLAELLAEAAQIRRIPAAHQVFAQFLIPTEVDSELLEVVARGGETVTEQLEETHVSIPRAGEALSNAWLVELDDLVMSGICDADRCHTLKDLGREDLTDLLNIEHAMVKADGAAAVVEEVRGFEEDLLVDEENIRSLLRWGREVAGGTVRHPLLGRLDGCETLVVLVPEIGELLRIGGRVFVHLEEGKEGLAESRTLAAFSRMVRNLPCCATLEPAIGMGTCSGARACCSE